MSLVANDSARAPWSLNKAWGRVQRQVAPYLFISPFYISFLIFGLFPIIFSFYLSFQNWEASEGLRAMTPAGINNYRYILTDPAFWSSLWNTLILALLSGIPQHLIAIPLAFLVQNSLKRFKSPISSIYFLPYITSSVAIALVFLSLYSKDFGVINQAIAAMNGWPVFGWFLPDEPIAWLRDPTMIKFAVAFMVVWRWVGWNLVLYLSGLQAIPAELYEAAAVDGATTGQQFRFVTLPLLRPMMFFAITMTIIGNMQMFEEPFILTNGRGGPGDSVLTIAMYLYESAFKQIGEMGTAAATTWILFVIIGAITIVNQRIFGREGLARGD
jgi:multiple sugar transport system permease protein